MELSDTKAAAQAEKLCFSDNPWSEQAFVNELNNELTSYYIASDNGRIIGYAGFWNVSGEGDITNVGVVPEYRRRGIAGMLIKKITDSARALGLSSLTLEVRKSNIAALNLYTKYGFKVVGERKRYYSNREDALLMTLILE